MVEKLISQQEWIWVDYLAWVSDSSGLVMIALDHPAAAPQVWHVPYPDGEARKITNDLNSYHGLSLTAASNTLVTVQSADVCNIWTAPRVDASRATQLTWGVGRYDGAEGVSWTPDDKIIFRSSAKGTNDVWIMERDGSNSKQLMVDAGNSSGLSVSPDGRHIAISSIRSGEINIWSQPLSGGKPVQLTNFTTGRIFNFDWSRDGKWLAFARGSMTNDVVLISDLR